MGLLALGFGEPATLIARMGSTDDCGFSPFSIDIKPKHGSPDVARDIAFQKITSRVKGTAMASEKLGLA